MANAVVLDSIGIIDGIGGSRRAVTVTYVGHDDERQKSEDLHDGGCLLSQAPEQWGARYC